MFSIRIALAADTALIRQLAHKVWPLTYASILSPAQISYMMDLIYSENALRQQMEKGHRFILLYEEEQPLGFASYSQLKPFVFKLQKLYVLPGLQGHGAGRFLTGYIIDEIRQQGGTLLQLNVNRYNKARSFYEKLGFKVIAEEDIDIGQDFFMNDYVMEKRW